MKNTVIDKLCDEINKVNRVKYPMRGYLCFAYIQGDGGRKRSVYAVTNDNGGMTSCYNGKTYRETASNLRKQLMPKV